MTQIYVKLKTTSRLKKHYLFFLPDIMGTRIWFITCYLCYFNRKQQYEYINRKTTRNFNNASVKKRNNDFRVGLRRYTNIMSIFFKLVKCQKTLYEQLNRIFFPLTFYNDGIVFGLISTSQFVVKLDIVSVAGRDLFYSSSKRQVE